jgi:hypothetical protein
MACSIFIVNSASFLVGGEVDSFQLNIKFKGRDYLVRDLVSLISGAFRDRTMAYIVSPEGSTAVSEHSDNTIIN